MLNVLHACVPQGRICSNSCTCCHTDTQVAAQTFYRAQSQYTDTGPTSPSADPITPGAWQGRHWSANFEVTGMTRPGKIPAQAGFQPLIFHSRGGRLNHKANEAVKAGDTGIDPHLQRSSHTSDLHTGTLAAALPTARSYRVSAGTGRPDVSIP